MVGIEPPTTGGVFEYTLHQCCAWLYTAQSAWVSIETWKEVPNLKGNARGGGMFTFSINMLINQLIV